MRAALVGVFILLVLPAFSNGESPLDKAIEQQNWKKVFKIVSREINGTKLPEGVYNAVFDSLVSTFKSYECVVDAEWTKCGAKKLIYPGQETIALRFATPSGEVEKTFLLHTSLYRTHIRVLGLRIRVPKIEREELVCLFMRDVEEGSMIESMRKVCVWEKEQARKRKHNSKVYIKARIIDGPEERTFPPLDFSCDSSMLKIEFSATNTTEESLKMYWPSNATTSDPLFRISMHASKPALNMYEDTTLYQHEYKILVLQPNETVKSVHYIVGNRIDETGIQHLFNPDQMTEIQTHSGKKGTVRISFSAVKNGMSWDQDPIWKPAEHDRLFHLAGYTVIDDCE
ncbi:MAG: hypothetical protein ACI837_002858 [Crocinitomicaceae bacterium]|jgi:hypothetical protein